MCQNICRSAISYDSTFQLNQGLLCIEDYKLTQQGIMFVYLLLPPPISLDQSTIPHIYHILLNFDPFDLHSLTSSCIAPFVILYVLSTWLLFLCASSFNFFIITIYFKFPLWQVSNPPSYSEETSLTSLNSK
uniref:Uncharacterized protein n=1 Tax=Cacopsylla melanoneura TaxID=428564 RepID=A0A8D8ZD85_9HEMI